MIKNEDLTIQELKMRIELYCHFPFGKDLKKHLAFYWGKMNEQSKKDVLNDYVAHMAYHNSFFNFYLVLFNVISNGSFKLQEGEYKKALFRLSSKLSTKYKLSVIEDIGEKISTKFFELNPDIKNNKEKIIKYLGNILIQQLISEYNLIVLNDCAEVDAMQNTGMKMRVEELKMNFNNTNLPNKKYSKEMFEHTKVLLIEGYTKRAAYLKTLEKFEKDEDKVESYGKRFREYLKTK
jgi:hypothetical protein